MSATREAHPRQQRVVRALARLGIFVAMAFLVGWVLKQVAVRFERDPRPAGFGRGLVQGAMMPCALPTLLVGVDVPIYAERNLGIPYKLGYTLGTTLCGALFFGVMFRRVSHWRRSHDETR